MRNARVRALIVATVLVVLAIVLPTSAALAGPYQSTDYYQGIADVLAEPDQQLYVDPSADYALTFGEIPTFNAMLASVDSTTVLVAQVNSDDAYGQAGMTAPVDVLSEYLDPEIGDIDTYVLAVVTDSGIQARAYYASASAINELNQASENASYDADNPERMLHSWIDAVNHIDFTSTADATATGTSSDEPSTVSQVTPTGLLLGGAIALGGGIVLVGLTLWTLVRLGFIPTATIWRSKKSDIVWQPQADAIPTTHLGTVPRSVESTEG